MGYTNSGKTTLLSVLSRDEALCGEDQLFATLDTATRRVRLPSGRTILMSDTVGFIRRLPPLLLASFRATLEEVCTAGHLVVVMDVGDPDIGATLDVIRGVLAELNASDRIVLVALNKIDRATVGQVEHARSLLEHQGFPVCPVSARCGDGLEQLLQTLDGLTS